MNKQPKNIYENGSFLSGHFFIEKVWYLAEENYKEKRKIIPEVRNRSPRVCGHDRALYRRVLCRLYSDLERSCWPHPLFLNKNFYYFPKSKISNFEIYSNLVTCNELFRVKKLLVFSGSHLVDNRGFEIDKNGSRDVFSGARFAEKSWQIFIVNGCRHGSVRVDSVFEAVEFPAGVADLDSGLSNVEGNNFSHFSKKN